MSSSTTVTSRPNKTSTTTNTGSHGANTRPVHPCYLSIWEGGGSGGNGSGGAEYSTWAYITPSARLTKLPNLVTAQSSTLNVYEIEETTGKLILIYTFPNLAGSVCYLDTLHTPNNNNNNNSDDDDVAVVPLSSSQPDSLLIGFSGHPRLAVVTIECVVNNNNNNIPSSTTTNTSSSLSSSSQILLATSLLDLTPAVTENSYGSVAPLEQDLIACTTTTTTTTIRKKNNNPNFVTVAIILGGGVSIVCIELHYKTNNGVVTAGAVPIGGHAMDDGAVPTGTATESTVPSTATTGGGKRGGWIASEPYMLPLHNLSRYLKLGDGMASSKDGSGTGGAANSSSSTKDLIQSIATGFGDILSTAFLPGYLEPTMVVLHSNPHTGRVWSGRLGRAITNDGGNKNGGAGDEGNGTRYGLIVTTISVTVTHQRSAILWNVEVPSDAIEVHAIGIDTCLVICVNSILIVTTSGQIKQCIAMNGWVKSTLPSKLYNKTECNPWPFPKLAIQLDGCRISSMTESTALITLRCGQLYFLQRTGGGGSSSSGCWCLLPLHQTIGAIGQVSNLKCWPFGNVPKAFASTMIGDKSVKTNGGKEKESVEMGLIFVGSRLGDSSLLGYGLETTSVEDAIKKEELLRETTVKSDATNVGGTKTGSNDDNGGPLDYDTILRLEEEALYSPIGINDDDDPSSLYGPHVIPPSSSDEEDMYDEDHNKNDLGSFNSRKRARMSQLIVVRSLTALDSLIALGPLGPGCEGPVAPSPHMPSSSSSSSISKIAGGDPPTIASSGYVFPCGYGSSGGVAVAMTPGRDGRSVIAEEDCINAQSIFTLPSRGIVLLGMSPDDGGSRFLQLERSTNDDPDVVKFEDDTNVIPNETHMLAEVDMDEWCMGGSANPKKLLATSTLLGAVELDAENFLLAVSTKLDETTTLSSLIALTETNGRLQIKFESELPLAEGVSIHSLTKFVRLSRRVTIVACTLSSGDAMLISVDSSGAVSTVDLYATTPMDIEENDQNEEAAFYRNGSIVALDLFEAPKSFFTAQDDTTLPGATASNAVGREKDPNDTDDDAFILDDDDLELYGVSVGGSAAKSSSPELPVQDTNQSTEDEAIFLAVCRQSGHLEVYSATDLSSGREPTPVWTSEGCGQGVGRLEPKNNNGDSQCRIPRMHMVHTVEMRFFFCGPSSTEWSNRRCSPRPFLLAIETNVGDTLLYSAEAVSNRNDSVSFSRVPIKVVTRPSQEQTRHFAKLRRKRIVDEKGDLASQLGFRHMRLHPFRNVSGQDGLFAAVSRPMWVVAERGKPTILYHRSRHVAPSGAKARPVAGFCSGILTKANSGSSGYMTIHERVGKVGTQRLTLFNGIFGTMNSQSIIPGGGLFVEKILLGVTVRRIQFIDDPNTSSAAHPLYAVLVSREIEADLSNLNDDGLTYEERQRLREEKENAKIKRQVEADLGGFDIEQEWVEEIERENCFKVDTDLGGAPPVPNRVYSLWVVDAANGWQVVDSYELGEQEHGMTMQVMQLTEFAAEPGAANVDAIEEEDLGNKLFITVGTGIVDKDGEDVNSKGRVLLFQVKRADGKSIVASSQVAELSFVYEKEIFHGPVSTLSCLVCEGKNRLIIGAGADVNVEQWGNGKLTQVGFFRATMHVLDIQLFKNFVVLSDAYDSLYFLIWRESDKSLTLLAKDYDPIPVYAAGLMSRGGSLSFVCHDDRQNLQFFQYAPGDAAARGGNKLVCRADFHLGSQTIALQSHFCRSSLLINSATPTSTLAALKQQDTFFGRTDDDQRLGIHFGTTDGGFGTITPLSEPVYWRLTALQSVMVNAIESDCALSQRAWRMYRRTPRRGGCRNNERKKGVIDGDLVCQFVDLPIADQEDLASAIGSTVELIMDNLLELRCASMVI